jgi:hypothetical protein
MGCDTRSEGSSEAGEAEGGEGGEFHGRRVLWVSLGTTKNEKKKLNSVA